MHAMADRTIVLSDIHGYVALLENALRHAGFSEGDQLVIAGDLVDIGPDECLRAAEEHGARILAGNHEVAAAIGLDITPQNPDTPERGPDFAGRFVSGEWPLAFAVDGWLITHAGISSSFAREIKATRGDADKLAATLNEEFREEMERFLAGELTVWSASRARIVMSESGPLWFRPRHLDWVPDGLRQIAGHTPPELLTRDGLAAIKSRGMLLTDPGVHLAEQIGGRYRYAVIEDGLAYVVSGELDPPHEE